LPVPSEAHDDWHSMKKLFLDSLDLFSTDAKNRMKKYQSVQKLHSDL
jgi:hypothetical protein